MQSHIKTFVLISTLLLSVFWALAATPVAAQLQGGDDATPFGTTTSRSIPQPLPADEAFAFNVVLNRADSLQLHWSIREGYYLYRQSISLDSEPAAITAPLDIPAGTQIEDMFFGEVEIFRHSLAVNVPMSTPAAGELRLTVQYQGCADIGYCYPMQSKTVTLQTR